MKTQMKAKMYNKPHLYKEIIPAGSGKIMKATRT